MSRELGRGTYRFSPLEPWARSEVTFVDDCDCCEIGVGTRSREIIDETEGGRGGRAICGSGGRGMREVDAIVGVG